MTTEKALCRKLALSMSALVALSFSAMAFDADTIAFYPLNEGTSGESAIGSGAAYNYVDSSVCPADVTAIHYAGYIGKVLWDADCPGRYVFDGVDPLSTPVAVYTNPASLYITGAQERGESGGYISFNGLSGRMAKAIAENGECTLELFWRIPDGETYRAWTQGAAILGNYTISGDAYTGLYLSLPMDAGDSMRCKQVRLSYNAAWNGANVSTLESHVGEWVHVAVVYTGGQFRIYNNYEASASFACTVANPADPDAYAFRFGCGDNIGQCGYRGKVSCVRLSSKALTPDEFLHCSDYEHFYEEAVPKNVAMDSHAIAFYPFDGTAAGKSVADVRLVNAIDAERSFGYLSSMQLGASVTFSDDVPGKYIFTNFSAGAVAVYTNPASIYFSGVPDASGWKGKSGNIAFTDIGTELSCKSEGTIELFWKLCETNQCPWYGTYVAYWETGIQGCTGQFALALPRIANTREHDYAREVAIIDFGSQTSADRRVIYDYPSYLSDGLWHHVAVTYSNGYYRLYCDYQYAGMTSAQLLHTEQAESKPFNFGNDFFNGYVSCVRVSDKALVPGEMLRASNLPDCRGNGDVDFYWRFEDGSHGDSIYSITNCCAIDFNDQNPQLYFREAASTGTVFRLDSSVPRPSYSQDVWKGLVVDGDGGAVTTNVRSAHLATTTLSDHGFTAGWGFLAPQELLVDGSFTAEMFARLDYASFKEHVLDIYDGHPRVGLMVHSIQGTNTGAWDLYLDALNDTPVVTLCVGTTDGIFTPFRSAAMASLLSGWHHYAVVYDAENRSVKVYVDQQCVVSQTLTCPLRTSEGDGYYIGCMGNNNFFDGNIDEIRVTRAALPPERFLVASRKSSAGLTLFVR